MWSGTVMRIRLIPWQIKKISLYKMSYVPEPYSNCKNKVKVELNLSNCSTKFDLKRATAIDTWKFAKKIDLATLKSIVNVKNLKTVPTDLSKLSNVAKNGVVKNVTYDELVKKSYFYSS